MAMLDELFDRLRDAGFGTIEGDICCSGCATNDPRIADGDNPGAYYTEQDVEGGFGDGIYIGYCVAGSYDDDDHEDRAFRAGAAVAWLADDVGFDVDWDGETSTKIWVGLP